MPRHFARLSRRPGRGFTLVELMIALTIGLLVTIGILTLLGSMRRTSTTQTGLSTLQDNERIAMSLISDLVQTAGYYPYGSSSTTLFPVTTTAPVFGTAGQFVTGATGDSITVRYATAGNTALLDKAIDCSGNTSATAKMYTATMSVVAGNLQCSLLVAGTTTTVTLVTGITSMTVLYGVQSNSGSTNNSVDAYLSASAVNAANLWGKVLCVKVTLNFVNPLAGQPGQPATGTTIPFTRVITVMNNTGVDS
jgi:type IV pilus assembly protein PilW